MRHLAFFISCVVLSTIAQAAELPGTTRNFIEKHCIECHNGDAKEGGLDLTSLQPEFSDGLTFQRWVNVHDRVRSGEHFIDSLVKP